MAFELPELPYNMDALEPHISAETLEYHYGKHHQAYLNNLNKLTSNNQWSNYTLEDLIQKTDGALFNNAAQVWNHTFYWNCLTPLSNHAPKGTLADAISTHFGSFDTFKEQFTQIAMGQFGSGWAWLCKNTSGALEISATSNAGNPMTTGSTPLLVCDVWEHAYYIDTRNNRGQYLLNFWELVNWDFVSANFATTLSGRSGR
jgi:Fe-Mn family superoxide dismutase